jgi:hypothetical protein
MCKHNFEKNMLTFAEHIRQTTRILKLT